MTPRLAMILLLLLLPCLTHAATYSLFEPTDTPAVENAADGNAIEVGVKFQSSVPGLVTAIRFYKGSGNIGTHVGRLYRGDGTLLGAVTFTDETSSGWQEQALIEPILLAANTTYVVTYYTTVGSYSADANFFTSAHTSGPLIALDDTTAGGNGVFNYTETSGTMPTDSFQASNYWVDVVFEPITPHSLRFFGGGVSAPDADRVKIQIDNPGDTNPGPPADIGAEDFTLEFWMKAAAADNTASSVTCGANINWINGNIVFDRDRFNQDRKFGLSIAGGVFVFGVSGDGTGDRTICGTTNVLDSQWHHIAIQRRRSDGRMDLYVDGTLEVQEDGPNGDISYPDNGVPGNFCGDGNDPCTNSDPYLVIGAEKHDAGAQFPSYNGFIDEVRLSNSLRYSGNFTRPSAPFTTDANTMALYHLDEGTGTTVNDSSGASGGPSQGVLNVGGSPAGPIWSTDVAPLTSDNPIPVISTLIPDNAVASDPSFDLVVQGSDFVAGAVVRWNGQDRSTTFGSDTEVMARIWAPDVMRPGSASVTVFNPAPGGGESNSLTFTIAASAFVGPFVRPTCVLAWDAVTENEDQTPITDLAGYRIYTTQTQGSYGAHTLQVNEQTTQTTCKALGLVIDEDTPYYVRVTAIDTSDNESAMSNEVQIVVTPGRVIIVP